MNAHAIRTSLKAAAITALVSFPTSAGAAVWGIKAHEHPGFVHPYSAPPSVLFHFQEDGSNFQEVASITIDSIEIDADALAIDQSGLLYAFEVTASTSRLLTLDSVTAVATPIGPVMQNRNIRGAVIDFSGRLLVLDASQNELLEVSKTTGEVVGEPLPLTLNSSPFSLSDPDLWTCDIAQRWDGMFIVSSFYRFFQIDPVSGTLTHIHSDLAVAYDGHTTVAMPGIAFSALSPDRSVMFAYEAQYDDSIYTYSTSSGFARAPLHLDIINRFNAGRGDLAAIARATQNVPPVILSHPNDVAVLHGEAATFSVMADGSSPLSYQWFFNDAAIAGATDVGFVVSDAAIVNTGRYSVVITNPFGSVTSRAAELEVVDDPALVVGHAVVWPSAASRAGYILEDAEFLDGTWEPSVQEIGAIGDDNLIIMDTSAGERRFYRLTRP